MTPEEATRRLFEAAESGNVEGAKTALSACADVNARDGDQETPLHWAAGKGHAHVAHLLIEFGADINAKDDLDRTPLRLALLCGYADIVKILRDAAKRQAARVRGREQRRGNSGD